MEEDYSARWMEYDNWTSYGKAELRVDGLEIHQLLDRIKSQLSILKRQQDLTNDTLKQFSSNDKSDVSSKDMLLMNEKIRRLEALIEKYSESLQNLENKVNDSEKSNDSKFNKLQNSIDLLMKQNEEFLKREEKNQKKINDLEKLLHRSVNDLKDKFDHFADQTSKELNKLNQTVGNLQSDVKYLKEKTDDLEIRTLSLKDHVVVNEMKMKILEERANEAAAITQELKEGFEAIPTTYIDPLQKAIDDLYNEKADRVELSEKADLAMIMTRAEVNDVLRLEDKVDELGRRIGGIDNEVKENVKTFDAKLDRKGERIAQWVLKIIRKEVTPNSNTKDGTDIGKVKCLVCDQVVPQNAEAGGTVFGGPGMKNVIKELHRNRSSSPNSPENKRNNNNKVNITSPLIIDDELPDHDKTHEQYSEVKITQQMNLLPKLQNTKHSKIVKLISAPIQSIENINTTSTHEDGNDNDFKYRVQTHEHHLNLSEQEGTRQLESNPLIPPSVNYFKDLEERYHNFNAGTGRKNQSALKRPTTAPIRK